MISLYEWTILRSTNESKGWNNDIIRCTTFTKELSNALWGCEVTALKDISFSVEEGEYVAVMGESGSGKTTLLNILATLDRPTAGSVFLNGENIQNISLKY